MRAHIFLLFTVISAFTFLQSDCKSAKNNKEAKHPRVQIGVNPFSYNPEYQRASINGKRSEKEKDKKDFARLTWNLFQMSAAENERKLRKKMRSERRKNLKAGGPQKKALIGPAGPRGPIGPPGPPGANITKEEMFEEFRQMIIKLIQNEVLHLPDSKLASLESNITKIKMQNILLEKELHTPKVVNAFMWELQDYIKVPQSSRIELDMFKESNRGGTLSRNMGSTNAVSGRFEAPRPGFYNFNARIQIYANIKKKKTPTELFSVSFCVSGNCEKKL
ncbi:adipolin [Trichonephila clavata]|uniref:Adipolin n=1 Tax=Trichonephila clavata TaxID=2740835 RepID=A0A8X6K5C9_TRICU|nr:adipolin [Trichonephila clavata]